MKKMNKKGFTLIELLAIIVILAIIAVITVPIILNVIEEAREGARKNSVIGYGKAVELAYTQLQWDRELGTVTTVTAKEDGSTVNVKFDPATSAAETVLKVDFDGDKVVCSGPNTIINGKVKLQGCKVAGSDKTYEYSEGKAK